MQGKKKFVVSFPSFMPARFGKTVVSDQPFASIGITEQLRADHPEHTPALQPQFRSLAIRRFENRHDRFTVFILILEPVFRSTLVVAAAHKPTLFQREMLLKPKQRIGGGHDASREEMAAEPIVLTLGFERIHQHAMAEDVDE